TTIVLLLAFGLWLAKLASMSLERLGLPPATVGVVLAASLVGGWVNIPVWHQRTRLPAHLVLSARGWIFYVPPRQRDRVLAINLGGAVVPLVVDAYLFSRAPLVPLLIAITVVAAVSYFAARPT